MTSRGYFPVIKKTEGMKLILQAANGSVPCSLEDLLTFITGADRIPPNGFSRMIKVQFFDVEALEKRRPFCLNLFFAAVSTKWYLRN